MHVFPNRGRLLIKDFELSTKFPFGFFRHRRRLPAKAAELIVFPRIESVDPELENTPMDAGNHSAGKRGTGLDLLALRNYQPQDDLRRIDWKATARTLQLTVREYADEDEKRVTVIFDTRVANDKTKPLRTKIAAEQGGKPVVPSEQFEAGATLTASILAHFTDENAEVQLVIDGDAGEFGMGKNHLYDSLKRLALLEPNFANDSSGELETALTRILNEAGDSHRFLVTANEGNGLSSDTLQRLKIIGF